MSDEYVIKSLADLFAVPMERRAAMFRDLEYAMALHEFVYLDKAAQSFTNLVWRDDGDHSVDLSVKGEPLLSLKVSKATP